MCLSVKVWCLRVWTGVILSVVCNGSSGGSLKLVPRFTKSIFIC